MGKPKLTCGCGGELRVIETYHSGQVIVRNRVCRTCGEETVTHEKLYEVKSVRTAKAIRLTGHS